MAILSRKKRLALAVKSIRRRLADGTPFDFSTIPDIETVLGDIVLGVQGMPHLTDADRTIYNPADGTYTQDDNGYWQNIKSYSSSEDGVTPSYWVYMETNDEFGETISQPNKSRRDWVFTTPVLGDGTYLPIKIGTFPTNSSDIGFCHLNGVIQDKPRCTLSDGTGWGSVPSVYIDSSGVVQNTSYSTLESWCAATDEPKTLYNTLDYYEKDNAPESGTYGGQKAVYEAGTYTNPATLADTESECDAIGGYWTSRYSIDNSDPNTFGRSNYYQNGMSESYRFFEAAKWGVDTIGAGATITWSIIPSNTTFSSIGFAPSASDDDTSDWANLPFTDYTFDMKAVFTEIERVCNITFQEVTWDSTDEVHADIIIGFAQLDGRSSGVKAYAYLPSGGVEGSADEYINPLSGNLFMDSDSTTWWSPTSSTISKPAGSFNWRAIFRHELLHGLGFKHNLDTDSAVYTNPLNYNVPEVFLSDGDKAGLQYLYGESTFTNTAPVVTNASVTVTNADTLTIDFVSYASDADYDMMTLNSASATSGTMNGNVYTPPGSSFTGTDTISYTVTDGEDVSNTGTITVTVTEPATSTGTVVMTFSNPDVTNDGPYSIWADEFKFQVNGSWVYWGDLTGTPTFSATTFNANYPASQSLDGLLSTQGWWHITASTSYPITMTFNFDSSSNEVITGIKYISGNNATYSDGSCDIDIEVDGVDKVTGATLTPGTAGTNWENDFTW